MGFGPQHSHVVHEGDLNAPSTQVDQDPLSPREVYSARDGEMNQAGLFGTGDHLQLDLRLLSNTIDQLLAVLRFPDRTGRNGAIADSVVIIHLPAEGDEGLHRRVHRVRVEPPRHEDLMPEADRNALGHQNREGILSRELGDDEADRVGARVDTSRAKREGSLR